MRHGPAPDQHDRGAEATRHARRGPNFAQHRPERARGSANCCRTRREWPTSCASSSRCTPRRSITIRPSPSSRPGHNCRAGRASAPGLSYGLGSENHDLPAYRRADLARHAAGRTTSRSTIDCGGAAFFPRSYQGVKLSQLAASRCSISPNPPGVDASCGGGMLDDLAELNQMRLAEAGDPEIATRIAQYEMAYRMQTSVPELDRPVGRTGRDVRHVRPRIRDARALTPPTACWPGAWPSGACASSSSSIAAGTSTRTSAAADARPVPRHRSGRRPR